VGCQRVMQGGVVLHAQITTEPDQGSGHKVVDGDTRERTDRLQ
jgi:hypothetical protein